MCCRSWSGSWTLGPPPHGRGTFVDQLDVGFLHAALAGIVSFVSPCVLPLALPYLAWIGGVAAGTTPAAPSSRGTRLVLTAAFVAGFVAMFVVLGIAAALAGGWLAAWQPVAAFIAGLILVALGLHVARVLPVSVLDMDARLHVAARPRTPCAAFVVGVTFAFGWAPCIGPILAAILALAAAEEAPMRGGLLLAVYGLGMGIPFMLGAIVTGPFERFVHRAPAYTRAIELTAGLLVIVTGVLIASGQFWRLGLWLLETFPIFARLG